MWVHLQVAVGARPGRREHTNARPRTSMWHQQMSQPDPATHGDRGGWVDPGVRGDFRWLGRLADESLGVCLESGGQNGSALFADGRGVSVVNVGGGVQAEAVVPVVVVVPGEGWQTGGS